MDLPPIGPPSRHSTPAAVPNDVKLRETAQAFEAAFLAEMLKHTGISDTRSEFGGGAGEDAFAGLLTQEYADLLAENGGVGLAERIFDVLKQRTSGQ